MLSCWEAASAFIGRAEREGGRVLVHCAAGVSRSSSTIVHYLMKREMGLLPGQGTIPDSLAIGTPADSIGVKPTTAEAWVEHLRARRRVVRPNIGFMVQLKAHYRGMNQLRIAMLKRRPAVEGSTSGSKPTSGGGATSTHAGASAKDPEKGGSLDMDSGSGAAGAASESAAPAAAGGGGDEMEC